MQTFARLLRRVPIWVWLFLAATQIAILAVRPFGIANLNSAIERFGDHPAYVELKDNFESIQRQYLRDLVAAAILAPLFSGLALWRWRQRHTLGNAPTPAEKPAT